MSQNTIYRPNVLIGMACKRMEPYRFSQEEAAKVGMRPEDTGVIILIIVYLIDRSKKKGEKVCRSKLEYYLLLLDRKCFKERGVLLFTWTLKKNGRIHNFKKFTEFMVNKGLIISNGSAYFELTKVGDGLGTYFAEIPIIARWLDNFIARWASDTAKNMEAEVIAAKNDQKYQDALNNVRNLLSI